LVALPEDDDGVGVGALLADDDASSHSQPFVRGFVNEGGFESFGEDDETGLFFGHCAACFCEPASG
jgi:hypothetical protein